MDARTLDELEQLAAEATERLGAVLVTVTAITPDQQEVARIHTTHPDVYPVGGRKRLDPSGTSPLWIEQVVVGQRPFVGADRAAVQSFFVDWRTIEQLGCGSIINTPVVADGVTIGSVNLLAPEGVLHERLVRAAVEITEAATPAISRAHAAMCAGWSR